jgi:hypothetical protein
MVTPNEKAVFRYTLSNDNSLFLIEACDILIDIVSYSLKFRLGGSEESYEDWSDWLPLTNENLVKFGYINLNPIFIEVEVHNTGLVDCLIFDTSFRGVFDYTINSEIESKGTFLEGYSVGNAYTNFLSSNLLDKVKNGNYTAAFITQTEDFDKVMSGITTFFASLFSYARVFKNITKSYKLLSKWLDNYGLYYSKTVTTLDDLNYLSENIYREFENRGTSYVTARKGELTEHSQFGSEPVKIDGEVIRILGIKADDEFVFRPRKVDEMSWWIDKTSPNTYGWPLGKSTHQSPYGGDTNSGYLQSIQNMLFLTAGEYGKNYSRFKMISYIASVSSGNKNGFKLDTSKDYCFSFEFKIENAGADSLTNISQTVFFCDENGLKVNTISISSFDPLVVFNNYGDSWGNIFTLRGNCKGKISMYIVSPNNLNPATLSKTFNYTNYHVSLRNFSDNAVSPMTTIGKYNPHEDIMYFGYNIELDKTLSHDVEIKNITLSPLDDTENCFIEPNAQADLFFEKTQEYLEDTEGALEKIKEVLPYGVQFKMP